MKAIIENGYFIVQMHAVGRDTSRWLRIVYCLKTGSVVGCGKIQAWINPETAGGRAFVKTETRW